MNLTDALLDFIAPGFRSTAEIDLVTLMEYAIHEAISAYKEDRALNLKHLTGPQQHLAKTVYELLTE